MQGICDLVADKMKQMHGLAYDPVTDIAICCGQTEAFAATMFASMSFDSITFYNTLVNVIVICLFGQY